MGKPMSNTKSVRTPMLPELSDDNKRLLLLPQVQANNQLTQDKSMTTPGNNPLRHLRLLSSDVMMIHLVPTAYVQETSLGTLNAMALKSTTRRKPTWDHSFRSKSPRIFSNCPTFSSQHSHRRCSDRRKRSWIQQIRNKFLLQEPIGASSPTTS
jgi:hypothetical protein